MPAAPAIDEIAGDVQPADRLHEVVRGHPAQLPDAARGSTSVALRERHQVFVGFLHQ
jgi:hypothetical protein